MITSNKMHSLYDVENTKGYQMIRSIDIRNFRCYKHLKIEKCSRLNVIVGGNGTGKTALLESIFFPLGSTTEIGMRLRLQRGMDRIVEGTPQGIEEALWEDFFYNQDMNNVISLTLEGDGLENRSLEIKRSGTNSMTLDLGGDEEYKASELEFTWKNSDGRFNTVTPSINQNKLTFPGTGESLNDFFMFAANYNPNTVENATRFSSLRRKKKQKSFVDIFTQEYNWIQELDIEAVAGNSVLYATLKDSGDRFPLPNVSTGINRIIGIMLAIATSTKGVVIVDEIENGIHYSHLPAIWRMIIKFLQEYECQLFVSTHSKECLNALVEAAGNNVDDIALWQTERSEGRHTVRQFTGNSLKSAIQYNEEIR